MATAEYTRFRQELTRHNHSAAIALAEAELIKSPTPDHFWLTQLAVAQIAAGQYEAGLNSANQALSMAPGNSFALLARADALYALTRYDEAQNDYMEIEPDPRVQYRARKGTLNCLTRRELWEELRQQLAAWQWHDQSARHWRLTALTKLGQRDEAMAEAKAWLKDEPDAPAALWAMTEMEIEQDGLDTVLARFARLARIPSKPTIYGEIYATLCKRAGKLADAAEQYRKMAGASTNPRLQRKQAFALAKNGQETEAIPIMEEVLLADPGDMYMNSAYVAACRRAQMLDHAWRFYQELLARFPDEKRLHGYCRRVAQYLENTP